MAVPTGKDRPTTSSRERPYLREALLLLGFLLVLAAAVVTVAVPELSKEPEPVGAGHAPATAAQKR